MQQRLPLLIVTGALSFGLLGYFLFVFDDGSQPGKTSVLHPLASRPKRVGGGANSAGNPAALPPGATGVPVSTSPGTPTSPASPTAQGAPGPTSTGPPE